MIANDDLAYKRCQICMPIFGCVYYALQNKFTLPFIVSKYVKHYTTGKLYYWPIRTHRQQLADYMQRMSIVITKHVLLVAASAIFPRIILCFHIKLHNNISEACYYASSVQTNWPRLFLIGHIHFEPALVSLNWPHKMYKL